MKGKIWTIIVLMALVVSLVVFNGCKKSEPAKPAAPSKAVEPNQPKK